MLTPEQLNNLPEDTKKEYLRTMVLLDEKKKEQTYVQKLLGLNRATSNSSQKYAGNVPSW